MAQPVIIQWGMSSLFGWGIYGLNLALNWASDRSLEAVCASPLQTDQITIDALRERVLLPLLVRSVHFQEKLSEFTNGSATADAPMLVALGNGLHASTAAHNVNLEGKPNIGVIFFEEPLDKDAIERAKNFSLIVAGSTWNEQVLRAYGIEQVCTVLQGVDTTYFHPAPKLGVLPGRFLIFSGGKAELRKGQDIVLAAFKLFAQRHPEATLVTAWHSPWPHLARSLDQTGIAAPVVFNEAGKLDVPAWAADNGIAAEQVMDLGNVSNLSMPAILREIDVAIFPNRAEGGTNLVAMECMASGVPVILSRNTGHLDLIEDDNCYPLADQSSPAGRWSSVGDVACWGESRVEEAVERLEQAFANRTEARQRGLRAAAMMERLTWSQTASRMKEIVLEAA